MADDETGGGRMPTEQPVADELDRSESWNSDPERTSFGRYFLRDLEGLWAELLKLAAVVEDSLSRSIRALCDGQVDEIDEVKRSKGLLDRREIEIERDCVRILAIHQPVASDLRRIAAVLKINGDLARLGDLSRHIAKRVKKLARDPQAFPIPQDLEDLALDALSLVHDCLDALTQSDTARAQAVIEADRSIDRRYRAVRKQLEREIIQLPERVATWLRLVNSARNLERIADHAVKIAEAVLYLKDGVIPRHRRSETDTAVVATTTESN
jgi:phosphate transport system protein